VQSATGEKRGGLGFEIIDCGFDILGSVGGLPVFVTDVEFRVVTFVLFVLHSVTGTNIAAEPVEFDGVVWVPVKGKAEAQTESQCVK
jgi:hypothetical protein